MFIRVWDLQNLIHLCQMDITVSFYTSSSEEAENLARSAEDPASENREHGETDQL